MQYRLSLISCMLLLSCPVFGKDPAACQQKINQIAENAANTTKTLGRAALVQQYSDLISEYPDCADQIYFELAHSYERMLPNAPPEIEKAFETYLLIIEKYENTSDADFMKKVKRRAANRGMEYDPAKAADILRKLASDYPDDDLLRLDCYLQLGNIALNEGKFAEAEEFFALILSYDPLPGVQQEAGSELSLNVIWRNASVGLFALAQRQDLPPDVKLAYLQEMLKKYPTIELWNSDMVREYQALLQKKIGGEGFLAPKQSDLSTPLSLPSTSTMGKPAAAAAQTPPPNASAITPAPAEKAPAAPPSHPVWIVVAIILGGLLAAGLIIFTVKSKK